MEKQPNSVLNWLNRSLTVKMAVIGFIILILLIPLTYVKFLISERSDRRQQVITEINEKWGRDNLISGPILRIPYMKREVYTKESEGQYPAKSFRTVKEFAYFMPDEFVGTSQLDAKTLKRGIYESVVYEGNLRVKGKLPSVEFKNQGIDEEDIIWEESTLMIQTSNLKGIKKSIEINFNGKEMSLYPQYNNHFGGPRNRTLHSLESEQFNYKEISGKDFSFDMEFNGSEGFKVVPIAKQTRLNMKSNWTSPSFIGEFLPNNDEDKVNKNGFNANWDILYYNRPFSQEFFGELPNLSEFSFGVNFLVPVDEYQKSERSAKYGYLVVSFTFLIFFLIQAVTKINIHPFQYLLIGLALVMFYTLLISISEHSNFLKAYFIASVSVIALIAAYSASVLKKKKFTLLIAGSLTALYSFIYVIIQLENYALLAGSVGLFIILAAVMYFSRKIDWQ